MTESIDEQAKRFGKYLRYWRTAKGISQEKLAFDLSCSPKHISFLENGRNQPSQSLILRAGDIFELSKIDTNHLMISAGFRPIHDLLENDAGETDIRDNSLATMLETVGNSPALIRDRFGNIKMMNKACVVIWEKWLGDALYDPELMNTNRLFFSDRGWRPFVENWDQVAMVFLMILNQERLLAPNPKADVLIETLSKVRGVPPEWDKGDSSHTKRSSFIVSLKHPKTGENSSSLICANTIGNLSQSVEGSLTLEIHCLMDREPPYSAAEISQMRDISHPLLPY